MAFAEASCHFIPFFISTCTKVDVVFVLLIFPIVVLFHIFQQLGSTVKEAVIPRILAVHVVTVVYVVTIDNFVMEAVDEEVAEIQVDVAVAGEPEGYTVLLEMIHPKKSHRQSSVRPQPREPPSRKTCWRSGVSVLDGLSEAMNRDKNGDDSRYSNGTNGWNLRCDTTNACSCVGGEGETLGFEITKNCAEGRPTLR